MKVVGHEPHTWFLLEDAGEFYLDVYCSHSFVGYSWTIQLSDYESAVYGNEGYKFIHELASKINDSAPILERSTSPFKNRSVAKSRQEIITEAIKQWREENI